MTATIPTFLRPGTQRPAPAPIPTIPTVRVPNRRTRIRLTGHCPFCGGSAFDLRLPAIDIERPHVAYRGTAFCLLCSRDCVQLEIGATP